jgi:hypothetical protein
VDAAPGRWTGELELAALAAWGHDHMAGHLGGVCGAVVLAHDVQAQVDAGGGAGAGGDVAMVDEEHVRVDPDARELLGQGGGEAPVGGGGSAVQQAGLGEHEGAGAQPEDAGSPAMRRPKGVDHGGRCRRVKGLPAGNDDRVCHPGRRQVGGDSDVVAGLRGDGSGPSAHTWKL